jgi:hypothetical protein
MKFAEVHRAGRKGNQVRMAPRLGDTALALAHVSSTFMPPHALLIWSVMMAPLAC